MKLNLPIRCWLFCTVIDNFGDIGVSWRLAQQLSQRLGWQVHLWLDDDVALRALVLDVPPTFPAIHQHIHLHHWQEGKDVADIDQLILPDVVIETFACHLPNNVLHMIEQHHPIWLNWEYLSAEDWAVRTHLMPSLQHNGSEKYFWQMGFVPQSGGLLREIDYRVPSIPKSSNIQIFAFTYASAVWSQWAQTLSQQNYSITLRCAGKPLQECLNVQKVGNLNIIWQSFVPQNQFDTLLYPSDINIIRGEDSFVRAQYAGKPFFWHIYPQENQAHADKLEAFWSLFWQNGATNIMQAHQALSAELNGLTQLSQHDRNQHWATLIKHWDDWYKQTQAWQAYLFNQDDAITRLAKWLNIPLQKV